MTTGYRYLSIARAPNASGNPEQTTDPDSSTEFYQYDSNGRVTYYRDCGGFVTLTERDADNNVIRIASGLKDVSGPGSEQPEPEAVQQISGYYPAGHATP